MKPYDSSITGTRLKELREDYNLVQKDLAKQFDSRQTAISKHESGTSLTLDMIIKYAAFYRVSTDYLLGLTDDPTPHYELPESEPRAKYPSQDYSIHHPPQNIILDDNFKLFLDEAINRALDARGITPPPAESSETA